MNAEAKTLADEVRLMAAAIYVATEKVAADDISARLKRIADFLDRLSAPVEGVGMTRYGLVRHGHFEAMIEPVKYGAFVRYDDAASAIADKVDDRVRLTAALAAKEAEIAVGREALRLASERCDELRTERAVLKAALALAATRLEILTGRMRACHEETGKHELLEEAEAFCTEARAALSPAQGLAEAEGGVKRWEYEASSYYEMLAKEIEKVTKFARAAETAERQRDEATALVERLRGMVKELDVVQTSAWLLCCEARADLGDRRLIKVVADKFDRAIRILAGEEKAPTSALLSEPQASEGRDG